MWWSADLQLSPEQPFHLTLGMGNRENANCSDIAAAPSVFLTEHEIHDPGKPVCHRM
jgi:hypothetical protein